MSALRILLCIIFFSIFSSVSAQEIDSAVVRYEIIPNHGQWHPAARYLIPIENGKMFLSFDGFTYQLKHPEDQRRWSEIRHQQLTKAREATVRMREHVIRFKFLGMEHSPRFREQDRKKTYYNYFQGNDPTKWVQRVHPFHQLQYREVYPGVDLALNAKQEVKYEWTLAAGSLQKIQQIRCQVEGADSLKIQNGQLVIYTSVGLLVEDRPYAYQWVDGQRQEVLFDYHLEGNVFTYTLRSELQEGLPLVIDPKLIFSTYSGSIGDNFGYTATYDSRGNLYSGGIIDTYSGPYPVTTGAFDTTWNGGVGRSPVNLPCDISISKYDSAGNQLLWATYLGGQDDEYPHSLVVDRNDNLIVLGTTHSDNFPYSKSAYDSTYNGGYDIIVSKLSEDGTTLLASTYIGGTANDGLVANGSSLQHNYADDFRGDVIPDDDNHVFVASITSSSGLPLFNDTKSSLSGAQDGYLFELNEDFSDLLWASYFGGSGIDGCYSIKLDQHNNIFVGGGTTSNDLPGSDTVLQSYRTGGVDGFIASFNKWDKQFKDLTYFGTNRYDQIYFIDIDKKGFVYATGQTEGSISKSSGTYGSNNKGQFIFKIDTAFLQLEWQTTFGNTDNAINLAPSAFLVDVCEHIYFSGWGSQFSRHPGSTNGMETTLDAEQKSTDNNDFYILVLDKDASGLLYATFFGGNLTADHVDGGTSRFDKRGVIYQSVCASCPPSGSTGQISDFPVSANAAFTQNVSVRCSNASFKIDLQIKTAVVADFVASPSIGCGPLEVKFTNRSILGDKWVWDFGDKDTSTAVHPTHTYSEPGLYTVTLTVVDSNTCNISDVYQRNILVIDQGTAQFELDYISCSDRFELIDQSEGALSYHWDFGDGNSSDEASPQHLYDQSGQYTITLTINDESLCADSVSHTVDIEKIGDQEFTLYNVFTPNQDKLNDCFHFDGLETFCEGIVWEVYNRWGERVFRTTDPYACWDGNLPDGTPLPESTYFYLLNLDPNDLYSQEVLSGTITLIR